MTTLGVTSTTVQKKDEIVPELLVAQRKELQDEISSINVQLEEAGQTPDAEKAELENLREMRDNLMEQTDKIDAILAKENPDTLSQQAANLPPTAIKSEPYKPPLDPRESDKDDLSETEDPLIVELDAKLLALIKESAAIIDEYEQKRIAMEAEKAEALREINAQKDRLMQDKKNYYSLKRQQNELMERLKSDTQNK
jgi:septal ring factor EnvC (AmiA/AmiB activator)